MFPASLRHGGRSSQVEAQTLDFMKLEPPGLSRVLDIPFPDRKLPVCEVCKKNYKTRELCRSRDGHTGLPWTTTYICITFEPSCFDSNGNLYDGKFTAKALTAQQPYCFKEDKGCSTPICSICKEKNYTRQYCREKLKHRQLPWGAVYVSLALVGNKKIIKRDAIRKQKRSSSSQGIKREGSEDSNTNPARKKRKNESPPDQDVTSTESPSIKKDEHQSFEDDDDDDDDDENMFKNIDESRTLLAIVSSQSCEFVWLDYDKTAVPPSPSNQQQRHMGSYGGDQFNFDQSSYYRGYYNYPPMSRGGSQGPPYTSSPQSSYQSSQQREQWYAYQPYSSPQGGGGQPPPYQPQYPQYSYYPPGAPSHSMYPEQQSYSGQPGYSSHSQSTSAPPAQYWHQYGQPPPSSGGPQRQPPQGGYPYSPGYPPYGSSGGPKGSPS